MGIRANTGTASIDVNDNGDTISFAVSDNEFLKRLSDFFGWFFSAKEEIEKMSNKQKNEGRDLDDIKDFESMIVAQEKLSNKTLEKLNVLFGDGTSEKIFGEISPSLVCVVDVIIQLSGEIERTAKEHNQYFTSNYSQSRKASREDV